MAKKNKSVCCVSDNTANIIKAIKILEWNHHPNLVHTINLLVKDAVKVMKPTVDKVKEIVEFFNRSTTATENFKSTQGQMGMPELKLKQECITRWNATFHMLKRILESKDAVISSLAVNNALVDPLSQEEWAVLLEAFKHLSYLSRSLWRSVKTGTVYKSNYTINIYIIIYINNIYTIKINIIIQLLLFLLLLLFLFLLLLYYWYKKYIRHEWT